MWLAIIIIYNIVKPYRYLFLRVNIGFGHQDDFVGLFLCGTV